MFIKISQLSNCPTLGVKDLFEISKCNDDNSHTTFNVTLNQLSQYLASSSFGISLYSDEISNSSFRGNPKSSSVSLFPILSNNNYSVAVTGEDLRIWSITDKTPSGFTISSNSNIPLTGNVWWKVNLL